MKYQAKKRFGQNFLIDHSVIDAIVSAIDVRADDVVVEIGPGLGALTKPLIDACAPHPLHVVELDRDLAARLRSEFGGRIEVHEADALEFDFHRLSSSGKRLRVVGNLPYNISSPLLFHLLESAVEVYDQHFMLQKEVVDRMVAEPGSKDYGRLSVMLQVKYSMERLFDVDPSAFDPPPKVVSAIVRMTPRGPGAHEPGEPELFARVVLQAFSQRRKMLRNTLAEFDRIVPMVSAGITPTARAEDVPVMTYVVYSNALAEATETHRLTAWDLAVQGDPR